jgi:hypothetical protein
MQRYAFLLVLTFCLSANIAIADETPDGKKSLGGSGEMIQFDLPASDRKLSGIEIHGSRYGTATPPDEMFLIYVMNEDRSRVVATLMAPYSLFERGDEKWVTIPFDDSVELPTNGWVVVDFRAGRTKGVYVSYDSDSDGSRSMAGLPGTKASKPDFKGDWMIRPIAVPSL